MSPSEATMARVEPGSLALDQKSPAPKVGKPGRKLPTPRPEKAETVGGGSHGGSPPPAASASLPSPMLKTHFHSLLETAWLSGLALPTWGHKASGPGWPSLHTQLLGGQSPPA